MSTLEQIRGPVLAPAVRFAVSRDLPVAVQTLRTSGSGSEDRQVVVFGCMGEPIVEGRDSRTGVFSR